MANTVIFKPAERVESRLNFGLAGPSGAGKTVAALRMAYGITGDWSKVFCIDTEHGSASLYQGDTRWTIGQFMHYNLDKPYSPARYIAAIEAAVRAGAEVVVVDQVSHAWSGTGGVLDIKEKAERSGKYNSYTAWSVATPEHNRLFETILTSPVHMICTMRSKTEYEFVPGGKGKGKVKRIGMAPVQRTDVEYEWTVMMELDRDSHKAVTVKTRSPVIVDGDEYEVDEDLGKSFLKWLESAKGYTPVGANEGYTAPQTPESRAQAAAAQASGKPVRPVTPPKAPAATTPPPTPPATQEAAPATDPHPLADKPPWADDSLSIEEARNIMYAVAVAEYGFENTDAVRKAIINKGDWSSISNIETITEIAGYLSTLNTEKEHTDAGNE